LAPIGVCNAGNSPNPRWAGRLCAKAFTEKLRILMQRLTTTTDGRVPLCVFKEKGEDVQPRFHAFISYSHAADGEFATALKRNLQQCAIFQEVHNPRIVHALALRGAPTP